MSEPDRYETPLATRYASPAMQRVWSEHHRSLTWRRLWVALAETQHALGLAIPDEALRQMRARVDHADPAEVRRHEARLRHDVMAHIHHFGDQAPAARPFLHLGATSAFVTDNADLILMREAIGLLLSRLIAVVRAQTEFATRHWATPTVAYTHFQPAQLTTVGKRATLWLQDFLFDAMTLQRLWQEMPFRGCKGTTGTQASYLELFNGDHAKVQELDRRVAAAFHFARTIPVSGQTYTRKIDSWVLDALGGIAQSSAKFSTDLRLLQHEGEILEPVERDQVGSSAMPYKRNPMRSERITSLARHILSQQASAHHTAATQWLERTLDDSAVRRLAIPESFLATDAILVLCSNVASGLEVIEPVVRRNVVRVMPFMATERWLMLGVAAGGDRQALHEVIRRHAWAVSDAVAQGAPNDLIDRLAKDPAFAAVDVAALRAELDPTRYIGRAAQQVTEFLDGPVSSSLEALRPFEATHEASVTV
ncbi:MAG: adenylosuccinate lyase [Gemmatimonadota bacterium]|nr:adenylosuccinate lyase [Gemmatimonadota bacterium]MDH3367017.1 adenylosuccinate lyase [Gemmatimonadota bacterium]MDH3478316.1 adenylosuccinate lyase [Gemmatimonadota bacterium]MDH3570978.1 adenylosuccinate lyase [Gemmatimonadota bacterium]MDH5550256.1 adenylosuccinate lyase [Gemmatimonadota bacterium]